MQYGFIITVNAPDGTQSEHRLLRTPFHIGSRRDIDLVLPGDKIAESHVRLLARSDQTVFLVNLAGDVFLANQLVEQHKPTEWQFDAVLRIGDYSLRLQAAAERIEKSTRRDAPVPYSPPVPPEFEIAEFEGDTPPGSTALEHKTTIPEINSPAGQAAQEQYHNLWLEPEKARSSTQEFRQTEPYSEAAVSGRETLPWETRAEEAAKLFSVFSNQPEVWLNDTVPKHWNHGNGISVQPSYNPINLAAGERIRVTLAVRNTTLQTIRCNMIMSQIRGDWEIHYPSSFKLDGMENVVFSIVIRAPAAMPPGTYPLSIHIGADPPIATVNLKLDVIVKESANLKAWFSPVEARSEKGSYLIVQNITSQQMNVGVQYMFNNHKTFVTGQPDRLTVQPGQQLQVALRLQAAGASNFSNLLIPYWVTLTTPNRAPLQVDGIIKKRARIIPAQVLIVILAGLLPLLIVGGFAFLMYVLLD